MEWQLYENYCLPICTNNPPGRAITEAVNRNASLKLPDNRAAHDMHTTTEHTVLFMLLCATTDRKDPKLEVFLQLELPGYDNTVV